MASLSPPFATRELNGEVLLDELQRLRVAAIAQRHLEDCAAGLRALRDTPIPEVPRAIQALAHQRFGATPELAGLLVRWAQKVGSPADLAALCGHFERLALASALVGAMHRGAGRLREGGR